MLKVRTHFILQADERDKNIIAVEGEASNESIFNKSDAVRQESKNTVEQENVIHNSKLSDEKEAPKIPFISEAVLNLFIVLSDDKNPDKREERNGTEHHLPPNLNITADIISSVSKPTAIVKPCKNSDIEILVTQTDILQVKGSVESSYSEWEIDAKTICDPEYGSPTVTDENIKLSPNKVNTVERQLEEEKVFVIVPKNALKTEGDFIEIASKLKEVEMEIITFGDEIKHVEENNRQMMLIVEEFENTINQLVVEKEREEVCQQIVRERSGWMMMMKYFKILLF